MLRLKSLFPERSDQQSSVNIFTAVNTDTQTTDKPTLQNPVNMHKQVRFSKMIIDKNSLIDTFTVSLFFKMHIIV